jgi:membrane protease subunit (stomatin/prohibitin family)
VWVVNKLYPANLNWTVGSMAVHDADYQTLLPLQAGGQYGLSVSDAEKFLLKMVGTKEVFTETDLLSQAYGEFCTKAKSLLIQFMTQRHVGFKSISAHLDELSQYLKTALMPFWDEYGLTMTKCYVNDVSIDTSTPEGQKVAAALASQASMSITGHSWQQEQMFGVANSAVDQISNAAGGNGLIAGIMAMNMMSGSMGGGLMQPHGNQPTFSGTTPTGGAPAPVGSTQPPVREVYCANCSKKHLTTERFCPHCGSEYHPCPKCGTDNPTNARRCVSCGTPLQQSTEGNVCPRCGAVVPISARFCPQCGQKMD